MAIGTPVTRRKRYSYVYSPMGDIVHADRDAASCFEWLAENEIWCYAVDTGHKILMIEARPAPFERSKAPWPK